MNNVYISYVKTLFASQRTRHQSGIFMAFYIVSILLFSKTRNNIQGISKQWVIFLKVLLEL